MPIAGQVYTKKVTLVGFPVDDPAIVELVTNPKGDIRENMPETLTKEQVVYFTFSRIIKSWNFVEPDGSPTPVTPENVERCVPIVALDQLAEEIGFKGLGEGKKNS